MKYNQAFTLVELIVVIGIVALLATLGLSTYTTVQEDARNAKRKADLKEIQKALEIYKQEKGAYPSTVGRTGCPASATVGDGNWCGMCDNFNTGSTKFTDIDADGDSDDAGVDSDDTGFIPDLAPGFLERLPIDPRNNLANASSAYNSCRTTKGWNCYLYNSNGVDYKLLSHCSPEGTMKADDPFYDPCRPTWGWQVSSSQTSRGISNAAKTGCSSGW